MLTGIGNRMCFIFKYQDFDAQADLTINMIAFCFSKENPHTNIHTRARVLNSSKEAMQWEPHFARNVDPNTIPFNNLD